MVVWNSAKNPPKADRKKFLVLIKSHSGNYFYHRIAYYSHDLYDFCGRKGKSGWFDCDSEWGYYEINNVVYWMELPEMPEELKNDE